MSPIAFYFGNTVIYWSSLVIVSGVAAGFLLGYALYTSHSGRGGAMWALLALTLPLALLSSRVVHFYFHPEQYSGLVGALTDYSCGSFFLPAALLCVFPAAGLVKLLGFSDTAGELLDALAPGLAFSAAMIRFSAVYTSSCRSSLPIRSSFLQWMPLAVKNSAGVWTFATFSVEGICLLVMTLLLLVFYYRHHADHMKRPCPRYGHTARLFFLLYFALELVMDSTRADSTVLRFSVLQFLNKYVSFISVTQLLSAVVLTALFVRYTRFCLRANGRTAMLIALSAAFALGVLGAGTAEYLVQRYTNRAALIYLVQSACALMMCIVVYAMMVFCRNDRRNRMRAMQAQQRSHVARRRG